MPSIRIKSTSYSPIHEFSFEPVDVLPGNAPTTLSANLVPPRMQRSMPSMREQSQPLSPTSPENSGPPRRPRAGTMTSIIHAHVMSSSRIPRVHAARDNDSGASTSQAASPLLHDGTITIEGSQADIVMRSSGEQGRISSEINLPHTDLHDLSLPDMNGIHHDDIVEHLDVIDPQVATVSSLTNAANTILIPPLSWYSRKPVLVLTSPSASLQDQEAGREKEERFEDSLDRHVDDVLRRPSKFRRTMRGVWSFLKTPMGVITGIYGFLVVFWGAAIVIFLAKIINLHNEDTQGFWVEVSSQIENGLFTVTGIGLIPSRVLDTYRICIIWHYKRKTRRLRAEAGLPQLFDVDDLPDPAYDPNYIHVLTEKQEKYLHRQQRKFQHHQTWYRPHGTETHRAFPINTALLICLLSDGNSIFQIMLCGCMWGLDRFTRPAWTTGTLIPASFICGILAAVYIWRGGQKTKRVARVEERLRAALAAETSLYHQDGGVEKKKLISQPSGISDKEPRADELAIDEQMLVPPAGRDEKA